MNPHKVLVIGANHHNTLSVIRALGINGVSSDLIIIGDEKGAISKSKYVQNTYLLDKAYSLLSFLDNPKLHNSIIFSCSDEVSSVLNDNLDKLRSLYHFFQCPIQGQLTILMDKFIQVQYANNAGFKVPLSKKFNNQDPYIFKSFPYVLKPLASIKGGKSIYIIHNENDLSCNELVNKSDIEFLVQEKINIKYEIVICGLSTPNKVIIPGYVKKHREVLGGTTYSTIYDISTLPDDVVHCAKELVRSMEYEGLFGIECAYDGKDFIFIEINLRNDATTYSLAVAGSNLIYAYYLDKMGLLYEHVVNNNIKKIKCMVEFKDFHKVLQGEVSLFKWIYQRKTAECLYYYNKDDIAPYLAEKQRIIKKIRKKILGF